MTKNEAKLLGAYPRTMLEALPTPKLLKLYRSEMTEAENAVNDAERERREILVEVQQEAELEVLDFDADEAYLYEMEL